MKKTTGGVDNEKTRHKWRRIMMRERDKRGMIGGPERRNLMESAKAVILELSLSKWSAFLVGCKLDAKGELLDMYSIFMHDVLQNLHLGIFLTQ